MQLSAWASAFLLVVLVVHVDVVGSRGGGGRGGGGGGRGGGGRGSSAARGSSASRSSSSNRGSSASSGSGYSSSNRGGIGGGTSTFSRGSGLGSIARSGTFKAAIAGAAAGYLTYQAGKAIIRTAGAGMMWGGRSYYWGPSYYQRRSGYEMCSMPLTNSADTTFGDVVFSDMTRPKQIVWSCRSYTEYCCGYECCPNAGGGFFGTGLMIFFIILLLMLCCGGVLLYKFFRRSLDCILGSNDNRGAVIDNSNVPFNPPAPAYSQPNYTQAYPAQPYGNQAYPLQPQYPQQPPPYGFKPY
uniref:CX domain-containing protein n=1 Tax=Plectus sambesii TaxID=2011161 RepID=A0A914XJ23_9BILA